MISLPDFVVKQIDQISRRTNISADDIRRDYEAIFEDVFIQQDEMFISDRERHSFAMKILWIRYVVLSSALTKEAEC